MNWMIEVARRGQKLITEEYCLPDSFTLATAAQWVGDHPDLIGSVFVVPPERLADLGRLLGFTADPEQTDYFLVARAAPVDRLRT